MNCPKCNSEFMDGCCIKCGYMLNGNQIEEKNADKFKEQKLFNKDFDKINRNKNLLLVWILGPLYFSYRGYFFIGTALGIIDYFIFYLFMNSITLNFLIFGNILLVFLFFLLDRLIYVVLANYICLLIDRVKIKVIRKIYKDNYIDKLRRYKHHKIYFLFTIIIYIVLIFIFFMIRRYKNGLL